MKDPVVYSIKNPYSARIEKVIALNKEGSTKSNHHVEISLEGSNISYEVGCSFGLLPNNLTVDVEEILSILNVDKDTKVIPKKIGREISIYDFFLQHVNLFRVTKKIAQALIPHQLDNTLANLLETDWKQYCADHDLVEFLKQFYNSSLSVDDLVDVVSPMLARFYSIASSKNVIGDKIYLLVADFSYTKGKKKHKSITSDHLLHQTSIRLFHQANPSFYPPEDDTPVIMIGPGTGIAAFLGFIQERVIHRKCKNNVLFTGDRHKEYDFYFEEELTSHEKDGNLKLFTAFSRDESKKVYVQDRMWEQKELLSDLICNKGAHIFVSGDAGKMAKDVILMIEKIIASEKQVSIEDAHTEVKALKKEKRLHMDVY